MKKRNISVITWDQFENDISIVLKKIIEFQQKKQRKFTAIYGIPRGGLCIAVRLSHLLDIPVVSYEETDFDTLVVDDVADSGKTLKSYHGFYETATLYKKDKSKIKPTFYARTINKYIIFPWELNYETINSKAKMGKKAS